MNYRPIEDLISPLTTASKVDLLNYLLPFISDNKRSLFDNYIQHRTRHITVVTEDLCQPHNASAVMRSCDCFGIQDLHIIENRNEYALNKEISLGSDQWVDVYNYKSKENNTVDCLQQLKNKGYRIVATTPHKNDCLIQELDISQKTALIFGTELEGLSQTVFELADDFVKIPMYGFTESFNISVSAGISLYTLTERLHKSDINWQLSEPEKTDILIKWTCQVVKKPELLVKYYLKNRK